MSILRPFGIHYEEAFRVVFPRALHASSIMRQSLDVHRKPHRKKILIDLWKIVYSRPLHHDKPLHQQYIHWSVRHLSLRSFMVIDCRIMCGTYPVLNAAVSAGRFDIARYLVTDIGANVNLPDINKQTALDLSIMKGDIRFVRFLLGKGADVDLGDPFFYAARQDPKITKLLFDRVANVNAIKVRGTGYGRYVSFFGDGHVAELYLRRYYHKRYEYLARVRHWRTIELWALLRTDVTAAQMFMVLGELSKLNIEDIVRFVNDNPTSQPRDMMRLAIMNNGAGNRNIDDFDRRERLARGLLGILTGKSVEEMASCVDTYHQTHDA